LSVSSPWSLKDTTGTTTAGGQFVTSFLPTATTGTATITATVTIPAVTGITTAPVVQTYSQNITADIPTSGTNSYQSSASVGSITDITIRVTDKNGNPVSSKKKKNLVSFATTSTGDNGFLVQTPSPVASTTLAGIAKNKVKGLSVALNDSGYADANFVLSTHPGDNFVIITPPAPLSATLISIAGIANLKPASIRMSVTPGGDPPTLTTDGTSKFTINYVLYDQWGNPSANQNLSISVNTGEKMVIASNSDGNVTITYGPKKDAGRYTLTATALNNPAVTATQILQFVSGNPTGIVAMANPQSMASLDVNSAATATVMAKVIDSMGNPVPGETVYFSIQSVNTGTYVQTQGPSIRGDSKKTADMGVEVSAVSDNNGYATATFTPGAFITDTQNPLFSLMAMGVADVRVRWTSVSKDLILSYKNYPYLSVYTSVNPMTVVTNSTVEVSIVVKGDGYALKPKPVDAYLVTDRSGSMSTIDSSSTFSRMDLVKNASSGFKDLFDYSVDRLGQFSFGDTTYYSDYVTLDQALTTKPDQINGAIKALTASGGTPLRYAFYKAITDLKNNGNSGSVKALVVLSDGDYNWYGDPLARGGACWSCDKYKKDGTCSPGHTVPCSPDSYDTGTQSYYSFSDLSSQDQNMSEYARANNIRIYAIGYSNVITSDGQATLRALANTTNGKYYYALTNADLVNFYGQIAGALKDTAGVNTTLALDFTGVDVNGVSKPGSSALQYMYINGKSTKVTHPDGSSETVDSTADWNKGKINVTMGTIKVNQQWVVNFTLNVTMAGNLKLLGSNSNVYFQDVNGNIGQASLPDTYITAIPEGSDKGLSTPELTISDLGVTTSKTDMNSASLVWHIDYENGKDTEIREQIDVAPLNSEAYSYAGSTTAVATDTFDTYVMSTSSLMPGVYKVRVTGYVDDAGSSSAQNLMTLTGTEKNPVILIR